MGRSEGQSNAAAADLVIPTLAAQLAVSPVLLALNGELHIYSLPANLLILPVQPLIMTISGLGLWLDC